jgi:hypothetical protein
MLVLMALPTLWLLHLCCQYCPQVRLLGEAYNYMLLDSR